jgi:hypothetical protein
MRRRLSPEDLGLVAWNAIGVPLIGSSAAAPLLALGEPPTPAVGVVQLLAVVGALVALATRPAGLAMPGFDDGDFRYGLLGPFIGAIAFIGGSASSHLGSDLDGPVIGLSFVIVVAAMVVHDRLPTVDPAVRRVLVVPFIFVCAGIFDAFAADLLRGVDLIELFAAARIDETGFGFFILGMLVAALATFYWMFVVAPRVFITPEQAVPGPIGCLTWPLRFVLYVLSALLGIGWLAALGG